MAMSDSNFKRRLLGLQSNLLNFAYQLTSSRDAAQDLVQDTTLKVLDNEDKYVDNVNFKGWVFTIMRNLFINNYRAAVRASVVKQRPFCHALSDDGAESEAARAVRRSSLSVIPQVRHRRPPPSPGCNTVESPQNDWNVGENPIPPKPPVNFCAQAAHKCISLTCPLIFCL